MKCIVINLQILNEYSAPVKTDQQIQNRVSDPFPILVRQMQTFGKQKAAGSSYSSTPPPSNRSYSKQTWLLLVALFGGGAYVIYKNLKGEGYGISSHNRKRKFFIFCS